MRIASLAPAVAEIVAGLGHGHELVARSHDCDFPPEVIGVPPVTQSLIPAGLTPAEIDREVRAAVKTGHPIYQLDAAALASLDPDVMITQATCEICSVAAAGPTLPYRALAYDPKRLEDVYSGIVEIAAAINAPRDGLALASHVRTRIDRAGAITADRPRRRVALVEWPDPIFAPGHWVPDVIEAGGAASVFGVAGARSTASSRDALIATEPEVVVFAFCGVDLPLTEDVVTDLLADPTWQKAMVGRRILAADGSAYFSRPGPRLTDSVELLAWALHQPHPEFRPIPGAVAEWTGTGWIDLAYVGVSTANWVR